MTEQEKAKNYDELVSLLREVFTGDGNVNFDGNVIDKIVHLIRPSDKWRYSQEQEDPLLNYIASTHKII